MFGKISASIGLAGLLALPAQAQAGIIPLDFSGPGVSGSLSLTVAPNPNTGVLPGTVPNPVDPIGSYVITGVTGTFSDAALGIANAVVTGIQPLNRVTPETTNLLAPNSFSLLPVLHGVDEGGGIISPGLHYDNLFYPAGSPQTASDYPFSGGYLDIYGLVFTIKNGDFVNLWSNGAAPPGGLNYGVGVTDGEDLLDYVGGVTVSGVPEAATWAMMVIGFGVAGAALRRQRKAAVRVRYA